VRVPPHWPRDTPLSKNVGTKIRRPVAVTQSVRFACRLRATEFNITLKTWPSLRFTLALNSVLRFAMSPLILSFVFRSCSKHCPSASRLSAVGVSLVTWTRLEERLILLLMLYNATFLSTGSNDSAVGIATGYGLADWGNGVRDLVVSRFFTCPYCRNQFWACPASSPVGRAVGAWNWPLTSNWYRDQENVYLYSLPYVPMS
jgi:hypothetical protein